MTKVKFCGIKRALSLLLSLIISFSCFAGVGFNVSAALDIPYGVIELDTEDKVWIYVGIGLETYLKFVPKCSGTYTLEFTSLSDMSATIYDVDGTILGSDDNGKDEENFRLSANLMGGVTYYFGVKLKNPSARGEGWVELTCSGTECEHENGLYSAGLAATCHSDGYEAGWWCEECAFWYVGHDKIDGGHFDASDDTDDLCDRCGGMMPSDTGEIGPSERPYKVKYQLYPDGTMDIYGTDYIKASVFADKTHVKNTAKTLKIYDGVKYIDDGVFNGFKLLETVTLPDSITSIRREAFMSCEKLQSINIPENVGYIAEYAFSGCKALTSIKLPDGMGGITNGLGWGVFQGCTSLNTLDLGKGIETIEQDCFKNCTSLKTVVGGDKVSAIKTSAFEGCTSLEEFSFSKELRSIGEAAFKNCAVLGRVSVKGTIPAIGMSAFQNCAALTTVFLTSNVKNIGESAFSGCYEITDVYYGGTSKGNLSVGRYNSTLENAVWHLNHCDGKADHRFDNACDADCNDCASTREVGEHKYSYDCDTTCDICGAQRSAGNHSYSTICDTTCDECGATRVVLVHYYVSDCDVDCSVCGLTRVASPHRYDNDCDAYCNGCSAKREITHAYTNLCDTSCNVCGMGRNAEHIYSYECDKACNRCGEVREADHNYMGECDTDCEYCGLKRKVTHNYSIESSSATFKQDGGNFKICILCGAKTGTVIKAVKTVKLSATSYTYSGKAKKPSVTVKDSAGMSLKNGTDYTVSYPKGCKKVGSYKVTVTLKGKYSGEKTLTFKINPKGTKISKVTPAKKSLKVKIAKQTKETTGYEVQYSTSKKFTKSATRTATVKKAKTTSLTLKKLKAKKTYYVRVRTFKTVGGKKFYSAWSKADSKKTK